MASGCTRPSHAARAFRCYDQESGYLSVEVGDVVTPLHESGDGWTFAQSQMERGWMPSSVLCDQNETAPHELSCDLPMTLLRGSEVRTAGPAVVGAQSGQAGKTLLIPVTIQGWVEVWEEVGDRLPHWETCDVRTPRPRKSCATLMADGSAEGSRWGAGVFNV